METGKSASEQLQKTGNDLTGVLDTLCDEAKDGRIKVGDMVESLNQRGFGPLLLAPALIIILPTGAIPGLPALCGLFMFMISAQIFLGQNSPWLPRRIKDASIQSQKLQAGIRKLRPYTEKIDQYVENRFSVLADNELSHRLVALTSMVLTLAIIFIGFIPFVPALLALPILFFALGLSVHDGLLLAVGYAALLLSVLVMPLLV